MRPLRIVALTLSAGIIAGGAGAVTVGSKRSSAFDDRARALQQTWTRDLADGVPASSIAPLRARLDRERPKGDWWSPAWWGNSGIPLIDDLQRQTDAGYAAALAGARQRAQVVLNAWRQEVDTKQAYVPPGEVTLAQAWPDQLGAATTPKEVEALAAVWQQQLDKTRAEAGAAEAKATARAHLEGQFTSVGGIKGLISKASDDVSTAQNDALDTGGVPDLITALRNQLDAGTEANPTAQKLLAAALQLEDAIALNDKISGEVGPMYTNIMQAQALGSANAGTLMSSYNAAKSAFTNARTMDQLRAVQAQVTSLQAAIQSELTAGRCGHNVGAGKVITLSLALQEAVMYEDGCVVNSTPITTGRPQLPTPAGNFQIFYKTSPFIMHSGWPKGSPYWYPDSYVQWVLEFAEGGYFLHDASWESSGQYGPGGQYGGGASHGCVHIPTRVMGWLYGWAPIGTPVIIS